MLDIAKLVPHHGTMCLLDEVQEWDARTIVCRASSHRRPDHPLRERSGLYAHCGVEYGAQAAAAHAALLNGPPRPGGRGLLAAVRNVVAAVPQLDTLEGILVVRAELLLSQDDTRRLYGITLSHHSRIILTARIAVVMLQPADSPSMVGGTAT